MSRLSIRQKRAFKRNGVLVLRDALDGDRIRAARELLWDAMPEDRNDPEAWVARDGDHDEIFHRRSTSETAKGLADVEPFEELFREVYPYAEELVGEDVLAPPDEPPMEYCLHGGHLLASREAGGPVLTHRGAIGPIIQYPKNLPVDDAEPFDYTEGRHVDGGTGPYAVGEDVSYLPFTIACAVYFDTVEPRGGGFTVWPGSHRRVGEYFAGADGYGDYPDLDDLGLGPGLEITGDPGTLVLWHHNLAHGAAPNHSERVRMAGFQRIARRDMADIGGSALGDTWKQYDAIRDLDPAVHESY